MEPTIYKPGAYKSPDIYNGAGGIYKGRGVYNDGSGLFVNIGGRSYKVVKIGNQFWTAENLDWKFPYNGGTLPIGLNGDPTFPAAWYYNNDEISFGYNGVYKCGLLYNGYAIDYIVNNIQLPTGWRFPTNNDLTILANSVNNSSNALKGKDISWAPNWNGIDLYGLKLLPTGHYYQSSFRELGEATYLWSSTEYNSFRLYRRGFDDSDIIYINDSDKINAFPIRLVKDA